VVACFGHAAAFKEIRPWFDAIETVYAGLLKNYEKIR
jgi:hypothetical protein